VILARVAMSSIVIDKRMRLLASLAGSARSPERPRRVLRPGVRGSIVYAEIPMHIRSSSRTVLTTRRLSLLARDCCTPSVAYHSENEEDGVE